MTDSEIFDLIDGVATALHTVTVDLVKLQTEVEWLTKLVLRHLEPNDPDLLRPTAPGTQSWGRDTT